MQIVKLLSVITIFATFAGGINALLCYVGFPVEIDEIIFKWPIIPMGAIHGSAIALITIGSSIALVNRNRILGILFCHACGSNQHK
jgi:hypothetical protein